MRRKRKKVERAKKAKKRRKKKPIKHPKDVQVLIQTGDDRRPVIADNDEPTAMLIEVSIPTVLDDIKAQLDIQEPDKIVLMTGSHELAKSEKIAHAVRAYGYTKSIEICVLKHKHSVK